jgi:GNAT superfamily N-acetyltransferase
VAVTLLRELRETDLPDAARLLAAEGWMFTPRELARLLATGPGLSVGAEQEGALVAMLTVARHGTLAWVGNVVTAPHHRGKGLGEAMVRDALARCEGAGARTVKLCAVPKAVSLYRRTGFRDEGAVATWAAMHERPTHRPVEAEILQADDVSDMVALDAPRFGGDRRRLFELLVRDHPDTGAGLRDVQGRLMAFGFLKPGEMGSELGPIVLAAGQQALGSKLLDALLGFRLEGYAMAVETTIPAGHPFMGPLLRARGFEHRDEKLLMGWGKPLAQDWVGCAALAGLEKG